MKAIFDMTDTRPCSELDEVDILKAMRVDVELASGETVNTNLFTYLDSLQVNWQRMGAFMQAIEAITDIANSSSGDGEKLAAIQTVLQAVNERDAAYVQRVKAGPPVAYQLDQEASE